MTFAGDFFLGQRRVLINIGQHIERQRRMFFKQMNVIAGDFLGGVGVHMSADALDFLGDIQRRAALGALE